MIIHIVCLLLAASALRADAACRKQAPPGTIHYEEGHKVEFTDLTAHILFNSRFHTGSVGEVIWLRFMPTANGKLPPHRHTHADMFYILKGTGIHYVMHKGASTVEEQPIRAGTFSFVPEGAIHTINVTGNEPLEGIGFTPGAFSPIYTYDHWPASTDEKGTLKPRPEWDEVCPYGEEHEEL